MPNDTNWKENQRERFKNAAESLQFLMCVEKPAPLDAAKTKGLLGEEQELIWTLNALSDRETIKAPMLLSLAALELNLFAETVSARAETLKKIGLLKENPDGYTPTAQGEKLLVWARTKGGQKPFEVTTWNKQ